MRCGQLSFFKEENVCINVFILFLETRKTTVLPDRLESNFPRVRFGIFEIERDGGDWTSGGAVNDGRWKDSRFPFSVLSHAHHVAGSDSREKSGRTGKIITLNF